jgi:hypothetical protein
MTKFRRSVMNSSTILVEAGKHQQIEQAFLTFLSCVVCAFAKQWKAISEEIGRAEGNTGTERGSIGGISEAWNVLAPAAALRCSERQM